MQHQSQKLLLVFSIILINTVGVTVYFLQSSTTVLELIYVEQCCSQVLRNERDDWTKLVSGTIAVSNEAGIVADYKDTLPMPPEFMSTADEEDVVASKICKCLDAVNLTSFYTDGSLAAAVQNGRHVLREIRRYIPQHSSEELNHCWDVEVQFSLKGMTLRGSINHTAFRIDDSGEQIQSSLTLKHLRMSYPSGFNYSFTHACLPEVFIPGFLKCGTTTLYHILTSHPKIVKAHAKEPHWWGTGATASSAAEFAPYLSLYLTNYAQQLSKLEKGIIVDGSASLLFGGSPDFIQDAERTAHCLLPAIIPTVLPKSKFIVIMRNPVDALYSSFWFTCTLSKLGIDLNGSEFKGPDTFHERVAASVRDFKVCMGRFSVAKCVMDYLPSETQSNSYSFPTNCGWIMLHRMIYYIHIQMWLAVVPRERFLFLTVEELSSDETASTLWHFLGLSAFNSTFSDNSHKNVQWKVDYHRDPRLMMRNDTRTLLQEFYHPFNQKLSELLGDDKFEWDE